METQEHSIEVHLTKRDYQKFVMHFHRTRYFFMALILMVLFCSMVILPFLMGIDFSLTMILPFLFVTGIFGFHSLQFITKLVKLMKAILH